MPVTITGTNFATTQSENSIRFNLTAGITSVATVNSLSTNVPTFTSSGRISVTTRYGKAVSSNYMFIAPPPFTAADVESTGTLLAGVGQTVTVGTAGKIALRVIEGTPGQPISISLTNNTLPGCYSLRMSVLNPDGTELRGADVCGSSGFVEPFVLPTLGTYTFMLRPYGASTGQATVTINGYYDVTDTIVIGGPSVVVNITTPGQNANLTFSGTAGQRVSLVVNSSTLVSCGSGVTKILNPDQTTLATANVCTGTIIEPVTLPASGTYSLLVNPATTATGQVTGVVSDI